MYACMYKCFHIDMEREVKIKIEIDLETHV